MNACRDILVEAFAALGAISFGGEPTADELDAGLSAMTRVILELHEARGPMTEIDVNADFLATENQRVRVEAGVSVAVTLPNSIPCEPKARWGDYGQANAGPAGPLGIASAADGSRSRPPRDGSRIEIVASTQVLYFYRSDINAWIVASPVEIDGPSPLAARYESALAALVAERLCDTMNVSPSAVLSRRIARGNGALLLRQSTPRQPARPSYF